MMRLKPGLDAAIGCNGRGVALTTALGREIGPWLAGRIADADLTLPLTAPRPIPFGRIPDLGHVSFFRSGKCATLSRHDSDRSHQLL